MGNSVTLFGKSTALSPLLAGVEDTLTSTLAGSTGSGSGYRRISIEGSVFREYVDGKEVRVSEERAINVVIVNAAPTSRMYFSGTYVKGQKAKPQCWSSNTQAPDAAVPEETRQATRCMDCPQNIKGSGSGTSRACRFQQRIAVMLEGELDKKKVYQVTLPSTSVFGDPEDKKMPLQAYGRHLKAHNTPVISVVTEMRFDTKSATPKVVFSPVRPLEDEELQLALEMKEHPDTIKAITLNVSQMDKVIPASAPASLEKPKQEEKVEVEEPKKVVKKSAPPVATDKTSLGDIVNEWDD